MKRHLLDVLTALSLLLCVAVCVLWVRSYAVADCWEQIDRDADLRVLSLRTSSGGVEICVRTGGPVAIPADETIRRWYRHTSVPAFGPFLKSTTPWQRAAARPQRREAGRQQQHEREDEQ